MKKKDFKLISLKKTSGALGALIENIDIKNNLSSDIMKEIKRAFNEYQVIFFRDQKFTPKNYFEFSKKIGIPVIYPFAKGLEKYPEITPILKSVKDKHNFGGVWHSDTSYLEQPPMATMLYALDVPDYGGDTKFSNQYLAYNELSDEMKKILNRLKAINISGKSNVVKTRSDLLKHSSVGLKGNELKAIHPVIRTHPETGKKALYINEAHTLKFVGMKNEESSSILNYLFKHQIKSEFTCRFKWEKGSLAIWDNRCTLHYPINDYQGKRRLMHRITFKGEKPI